MKYKIVGIALALFEPNIEYLSIQLRSIRNQHWADWICWIQADSSIHPLRTDTRLIEFFQDSRFIWQETPKRLGPKKNFELANKNLLSQQVDAIAFCDQDDFWLPEKLSLCLAELNQLPDYSLVHHDMLLIDKHGIKIASSLWQKEKRKPLSYSTEDLLVRNIVTGCSCILDAKLVERFPEIPDALDYHDRWYALLSSQTGKIKAIDETLSHYRQHERNVIGSQDINTIKKLKDSPWQNILRNYQESLGYARCLPNFSTNIFSIQDFGLTLYLRAIRNLALDFPLARAYFFRAIAKSAYSFKC